MQQSDAADGRVVRAANAFVGKAKREASLVLPDVLGHTLLRDCPLIVKVMARSDFHFSELGHRITSISLVLPPDRMDAYSHWRVSLVSQALQRVGRDAEMSHTGRTSQRSDCRTAACRVSEGPAPSLSPLVG